MPLWGKNDAASNSTIYAPTSVKLAPNSANRDNLFNNTTADAFITGVTVGQFGVDSNEIAVNPEVAHTGWVLRTVGSGGRAGRVMHEVLVAGGIGSDSEDTVFPDAVLAITTDPVAVSANSSNNESRTFSVVIDKVPTSATPTYLWYYSTTSGTTGFNTTAAVSGFSGQTTDTLTANSATLAANVWVKAVVSVTGGASVNSASAKLTVTS
jgi:hypothetical protein